MILAISIRRAAPDKGGSNSRVVRGLGKYISMPSGSSAESSTRNSSTAEQVSISPNVSDTDKAFGIRRRYMYFGIYWHARQITDTSV